MPETRRLFQIGDLAVPANGIVGFTYVIVDFDDESVTVAWRGLDDRIHEKTLPHDAVELA